MMPSEDQLIPLESLVDLQTTKAAGPKDPSRPYVGLEHMASGSSTLLGSHPSSYSNGVNCVFEANDILFGKLRPNLRKCVLAPFDGYCSTDILVLRAKEGVNCRYASRVLQSEQMFRAAVATAAGTKMPRTSWGDLKRVKAVAARTAEEQGCIATILDLLDTAIERTELIIAKSRFLRIGLLQDLLTCGIDSNGALRIAASEPASFSQSPIGMVPKQWAVRSIKDVLRETGGRLQTGPFGSQLHASEYVSEGVPVIMPQDILEGRIETSQIARVPEQKARSMARHRVCARDVVLSRRGDLSRAAPIARREKDWLCGTGCFLIRFGSDVIDTRWFVEAYRSYAVQRQIAAQTVGTTMPSLNNGIIESLKFAWPPPLEQSAIADRLEQHDRLASQMVNELSVLRSIKAGMTHDLLSGNVQAPTASRVLEAAR